jgi:predicted thioesterase
MKDGLKPGLTYTQTYETTERMRATQLTADVFSTPAMIGLMEGTCVRLTAPYLDEGENSVGMHVDVHHLAPTKIGQSVDSSSAPATRPITRPPSRLPSR